MSGTLFVVATPIGNLDDITLRALRVLREATLIAAEDTRRTAQLLARHGIATPTTSLHEHNEHRKTASLLDKLQHGASIALVSDAGTPTVSDPGAELIRAAVEVGIRVEPVPGPNAAVAALSASGLLTDYFSFHGFPPNRSKDRKLWVQRIREIGGVVVFYEAPHRIAATLTEMFEAIGDRPAILARELTKVHEELVRGPISALLAAVKNPRGEYTVVVDVGAARHKSQEFWQITDLEGAGKRRAITEIARLVGVSPNDLYRAIEELKN
jgi:16S rRNA (cytidine1402-2'-O)-methyltransferase